MSNNNVVSIIKTVDEEIIDDAWKRVKDALNTVATLDRVNEKPLNRTSKVMKQALIDLFLSIHNYDALRNRK